MSMNVTVTVSTGDIIIDAHTLDVDTDTGEATLSTRSGGVIKFPNVREAKNFLLVQVSTDVTYGRSVVRP